MNLPSTCRELSGTENQSPIFCLWASADEFVPFPYLYTWRLYPVPGCEATTLHQLSEGEFVYRITGEFTAHLTTSDGHFATPTLHRETFGFRLMPVPGRQGLLSPERAEELLLRHLEQQAPSFWHGFGTRAPRDGAAGTAADFLQSFRRSSWHSLRFDQPFGAGIVEPVYRFRKEHTRLEFQIGARSGNIRSHPISDQ